MAYKYPKRHETFEGQGRPKGSRTKNNELRELIRDFAADKFGEYLKAFSDLDPKEKTREYREMLKYVVPTITAIQFDQEGAVSSAREHLKALTGYGTEAEPQSAGDEANEANKPNGKDKKTSEGKPQSASKTKTKTKK